MKTSIQCLALLFLGISVAFGLDARRDAPRTLDGYHPFHPVSSAGDWPKRQAEIRLRTQVAAGLWPLPEKTPLQTIVHGTIDRGDYTVSRVVFQSLPGHSVTGSLFQPAGKSLEYGLVQGKRPGVLCPHGHWKNGRFYDTGEQAALEEIAIGAERFVAAARNPVQARCVQLARMGCTVFLYDMLGYADSIQFPEHRTGVRPHLCSLSPGEWGFVSPAAASRLQTNFGLQTWNSVRSLDFLLSLPGIDPGRILVTGASGGGTQTMVLSAIDDRVSAAFPCVMVSTAMQGGCTCENSHLLRIGQGNIDIAAAVSPKPLGLTAADDWTVELKTKGHPDLLALYKMLGVPSKYEAHFNTQFKHNYNHVSRTQMYGFVNRHFNLGLPNPVLERDFIRLEKPDLTVWNEAHPAPSGDQTGESHEKSVCRWWTEDSVRQIEKPLLQNDRASVQRAQSVLRRAWAVLIGRELPSAEEIRFEPGTEIRKDSSTSSLGVIQNVRRGEEVRVLIRSGEALAKSVVVWLSAPGAEPKIDDPAVQNLISKGCAVVFPELFGADLKGNPPAFYPGNSSKPENQWKQSPVYFYGYNDSLFARRVHDVLTTIAFVKTKAEWKTIRPSLVGLRGTGAFACAALAVAGSSIERAVVESDGFRFAKLTDHWHSDFLPGAAKYGDILGMLSLRAPEPLWIAGQDGELDRQVEGMYQAMGAAQNLHCADSGTEALTAWLLSHPEG